MARYKIENGACSFQIEASGRDEWALLQLASAGEQGCTPIDTPGPRWSGYVHNLRGKGVEIETRLERHSGPFPGRHARYILHGKICLLEVSDAA